ncbi:hypothetical protein C6P40_002704 [Pichia californica]|uniref:Uncharacterized protein n=1 Tax=Pichia californica TaxID=460514 RepID=A0A9P6WRR3_9ASCO|nr:hypothetical protein C6P42_001655 [[Candida] californica]KAG0691313.1 hypothetical protein C6P40_002704 [[Candida] californica]
MTVIIIPHKFLESNNVTKLKCPHDGIYFNGTITCEIKQNKYSELSIFFEIFLLPLVGVVFLIIAFFCFPDKNTTAANSSNNLSTDNIDSTDDPIPIPIPMSNPAPLYTINPDPTNDYGFYDSSGSLVSVKPPKLSFNKKVFPKKPPKYISNIEMQSLPSVLHNHETSRAELEQMITSFSNPPRYTKNQQNNQNNNRDMK